MTCIVQHSRQGFSNFIDFIKLSILITSTAVLSSRNVTQIQMNTYTAARFKAWNFTFISFTFCHKSILDRWWHPCEMEALSAATEKLCCAVLCWGKVIWHQSPDMQAGACTVELWSVGCLVTYRSHIDRCANGCVVECRICNQEVAGSNLGLGYFAPRSAQPSIPPGSVNEYQLWLGRQRQVWLIPIAGERVGVQVKLWNPLRTRAIPECFCGVDLLRRGTISNVCTFTFYELRLEAERKSCRQHWIPSITGDI